ncbi:MAG TPA: hypothetical protein PKE30_02670 [Niabella sp.]|mgnify:CR=1 FL=1|nr:hypothetical protein [Niabella sp.]
MKIKFLLTIIILSAGFTTVHAQIEKGSWLIGGQAGFYSSKNKAESPSNLSSQKGRNSAFEILSGYSFKKNQILGVIVSLTSAKQSYSFSGSTPNTNYINNIGAGAFYRAYKPLGSNFYIFGQAAALYTKGKTKTETISSSITEKTNGANLSLMPGISYQVLKNAQIELAIPNIVSLNYAKAKSSTEEQVTMPGKETFSVNTSLNAGVLQNLGIGFKIFL